MPSALRHISRAGLSYVELAVVIAVIGLMVLFGLPKVGPAYDHTMVLSARTALTNLYNATRTAARASNRVAVLKLNENVVVIERNFPFPSTAKDTVTMGGQFHDFAKQYGVSITGPDSVRVEPRGMLIPAASHTWVITRDDWADSVMVNSYGRMIR